MATTDHRHPDAPTDGATRDISQYLRAEASGPEALAPITDGAIRDLQKALVERIADVDDDRRRGTILLQKAFNSHRAKTEARLSQLRLVLAIVLGAGALLLAAGLGALAWDHAQQTRALSSRLAATESRLAGITARPEADAAALGDLNGRLDQLAGRSDELAQRVAELADRDPGANDRDLGAMVAPLLAPVQARVEELAGKLAAATPDPDTAKANAALRTELTAALAALRTDLDARSKAAEAAATALRTDLEARAKTSQAATVALRAELTAGIATLRADLDARTKATETAVSALRAELAPLQADLAARTKAGPGDPAALRKELTTGIEALREALATSTAETREAAVAAAQQAVGPLVEQATAGTAADAANAAANAVRGVLAEHGGRAGQPEASIDELIDQQLSRLQREYQSLARQADAPAVAPAGGLRRLDNPPTAQEPAEMDTAAPAGDDEASATSAARSGPVVRVGDQTYAVQLIGFHSMAEAQEFVSQHDLPAEVYVRAEELRGRPWYVLIHSLHRDLAGATAAQAALPVSLAGLDVWIRALPADAELQTIGGQTGASRP